MSDDASKRTTTARRTWRLIGALALPWVVCGGGLWLLIAATPTAIMVEAGSGPTGLTADVGLVAATPANPYVLTVIWNLRGLASAEVDDLNDPLISALPFGPTWFSLFAGDSATGRWAVLHVSFWLLLPVPLLWSGVDLWRWTRRRSNA